MHPTKPIGDRFWPKVDVRGPNECWLWTGAHSRRMRHGLISRGRAGTGHVGAHRVSWQIHNGAIPDGLFVLHSCDNPPCVNPAHLFLGTAAANSADMRAKQRGSFGEHRWSARLVETDIRAIRARAAAGVSSRVIARDYGVDPAHIRAIVRRRFWKHVP